MKKVYTTLFAILLMGGLAMAQKKDIRKADGHFKEREYEKAAEVYSEIEDKGQETLQNLADSYYYLNDFGNAEEAYQQLFENHGQNLGQEYLFRYAHTLRAQEKHEEADQYFKDYYGTDTDFNRWQEEVDSTASFTYELQEHFQDNLFSNFGISFLDENTVVFASSRNTERPEYSWNNQPYLDLYIADYSNGELSNIRLLPGDVNTDTHESSATFNSEGDVMYFDRTNSKRVKDKEEGVKVAHISIFKAEFLEGEWTNVERVPFASNDYTTEHPSLSADGTKLYFASDMPGSLGSYDIYVVEVKEDGTFGEPENLGPTINTPLREQFPFISGNDTLYFSSNGRFGFGNLDIFRSEKENGNFSEPSNLGSTINSLHDDFAFSIDKERDLGFFTSNQEEKDVLHSFERAEKMPPSVAPEEIVETNVKTGARQLKDIGDIYFNFDEAKILPEAEKSLQKVIAIMKEYPELKIEIGSHADVRGTESYNQRLSERRAQATLEYIVSQGIEEERITARGYGESMPLNECSEDHSQECSKEEHAVNRRSEFKVLN